MNFVTVHEFCHCKLILSLQINFVTAYEFCHCKCFLSLHMISCHYTCFCCSFIVTALAFIHCTIIFLLHIIIDIVHEFCHCTFFSSLHMIFVTANVFLYVIFVDSYPIYYNSCIMNCLQSQNIHSSNSQIKYFKLQYISALVITLDYV